MNGILHSNAYLFSIVVIVVAVVYTSFDWNERKKVENSVWNYRSNNDNFGIDRYYVADVRRRY